MTKTRQFRELLESGRLVVSPGIYDGYSARLVESMGYSAASTTGAGLANSRLGVADNGTMSMLENVDACRHLVRNVGIPIMADADTGYGNALSVYSTVQYFEATGVVGINIEDQTYPKRCGHMRGKELITIAEMVKKIEAAVDAKTDQDFVINARTDSLVVEGLDHAVERIRAYGAAGADMVFPDAVRSQTDIEAFVRASSVPVSVNMGFGIRSRPTTPLLSTDHLQDLGVARVTLPRMLTAAAIRGMQLALKIFSEGMATGEIADRPDLLCSIDDITQLMGYDSLAELESKYLLPDQLEQKYGGTGDSAGPTSWVRTSSS